MPWFIKLSAYDYSIEHKSGRRIAHADTLSHYPIPDVGNECPSFTKPLFTHLQSNADPGDHFEATIWVPVTMSILALTGRKV